MSAIFAAILVALVSEDVWIFLHGGRSMIGKYLAADRPYTLAQFEQLRDSMTYVQVKEIMHSPGEQIGHVNMGFVIDDSYRWMNPGGSNMILIFQNDRLIMKNQMGLP